MVPVPDLLDKLRDFPLEKYSDKIGFHGFAQNISHITEK